MFREHTSSHTDGLRQHDARVTGGRTERGKSHCCHQDSMTVFLVSYKQT
jgi:hypothetical protein